MKRVILLFFIVFAVLPCLGASCNYNKAKVALQATNYAGYVALMAAYRVGYDYLDSEEGVKEICDAITQAHAEQIKDGTYTEANFTADCQAKVAEVEKQLDTALSSVAFALQELARALAMWDVITEQDGKTIIGWNKMTSTEKRLLFSNIVGAFEDAVKLLDALGVKVPESVKSIIQALSRPFEEA